MKGLIPVGDTISPDTLELRQSSRGLTIASGSVLLAEDNHLLVLNKPAGLLTQPSGTDQESLEGLAKGWLKEVYQKPGNVFLEAIHRLDKPVSGVVVFGKTSKAVARLNASMRMRRTRKIYWAWVEGSPTLDEGEAEHLLIHDDFRAEAVPVGHPEGKRARLVYRVLQRRKERALIEIELDTGRYHQIRVQLALLGHPIVGDRKYGAHQRYLPEAIALHHQCFQFPHPIAQTDVRYEALPSPSFEQLGASRCLS